MNRSTVVIAALVAALAYATNPDDESFKKYIDACLKRDGTSWLTRTLAVKISSLFYTRKDYRLFSVVNVPEEGLSYLGLFGIWIPISSQNGVGRPN